MARFLLQVHLPRNRQGLARIARSGSPGRPVHGSRQCERRFQGWARGGAQWRQVQGEPPRRMTPHRTRVRRLVLKTVRHLPQRDADLDRNGESRLRLPRESAFEAVIHPIRFTKPIRERLRHGRRRRKPERERDEDRDERSGLGLRAGSMRALILAAALVLAAPSYACNIWQGDTEEREACRDSNARNASAEEQSAAN